MKHLLQFVFFAIIPFNFIFGQTYNSVVSDQEVLTFLNWEINQTIKEKFSLKKVYLKPAKWTEVNFNIPIGTSEHDLLYYRMEYLFRKENQLDSIFDSIGKDLLYAQYKTEKSFVWEKLKNIRTSKRLKNSYIYSMPIFSREYVIIYKSTYRGRESGSGCYYVYKKKDKSWVLKRTINCWIS